MTREIMSSRDAQCNTGEWPKGGWKQFPVLSKTYSLMGHYNLSIPVDAKIMASTNCPIKGEQVAVNFVAQ